MTNSNIENVIESVIYAYQKEYDCIYSLYLEKDGTYQLDSSKNPNTLYLRDNSEQTTCYIDLKSNIQIEFTWIIKKGIPKLTFKVIGDNVSYTLKNKDGSKFNGDFKWWEDYLLTVNSIKIWIALRDYLNQ
jgi:hypothetical protein